MRGYEELAYTERVAAITTAMWREEKRIFISKKRAYQLLGCGPLKLKEMMEVAGWEGEAILIHHLPILPDLYREIKAKQ